MEATPPWLKAKCRPNVAQNAQRDLATLSETFDMARMPSDHPLSVLWNSETSAARFALHHLADDLREVANVEGVKSTLRQLVKSPSTFEDTRFELRTAAAVARGAGQTLLRLGADNPGPDVEFTSTSGHRCGIACYRAHSASATIVRSQEAALRLAKVLGPILDGHPIPADIVLEITFPRAPPDEADIAEVEELLPVLWKDADWPELLGATGVRLARVAATTSRSEVPRITTMRFLFAISEGERDRIARHVNEKCARESKAWASSFDGRAIFAIDESPFCHDLHAVLSADGGCDAPAFAVLLLTQPFFPHAPDGRLHLTERIRPVLLRERDLKFAYETFGDNLERWLRGGTLVEYVPQYALTEWELIVTGASVDGHVRVPLTIERKFERLPKLGPGPRPADDPKFRRALDQAVSRMRR
jgi:hypothetical protein